MPRIRSIHPGIWTDDKFVSLKMAARLLFIGILNECDDQGVFIWNPAQLKMRVLPSDRVDATALLGDLEKCGLVSRYRVGGAVLGGVRHFREFQRPKKPNSVHPITDEIRAFTGTKAEFGSLPVGNRWGTNGEAVPQRFPQYKEGRGEKKKESPTPTPPPQSGGGAQADLVGIGKEVSSAEPVPQEVAPREPFRVLTGGAAA